MRRIGLWPWGSQGSAPADSSTSAPCSRSTLSSVAKVIHYYSRRVKRIWESLWWTDNILIIYSPNYRCPILNLFPMTWMHSSILVIQANLLLDLSLLCIVCPVLTTLTHRWDITGRMLRI